MQSQARKECEKKRKTEIQLATSTPKPPIFKTPNHQASYQKSPQTQQHLFESQKEGYTPDSTCRSFPNEKGQSGGTISRIYLSRRKSIQCGIHLRIPCSPSLHMHPSRSPYLARPVERFSTHAITHTFMGGDLRIQGRCP